MSERTRARRLPIELIEALSASGGGSADETELRTRLCQGLLRDVLNNGLTKTQKCYIILYYRDGLTMEEIAKRYGVNRSTVSRTVAAARRRIEKRMKLMLLVR